MLRTRMTTLPFLLLALLPFLIFDRDYPLILCQRPFGIYTCRNVEQDQMTCRFTRLTTLAFLLLELSPFVLFEIDFLSTL